MARRLQSALGDPSLLIAEGIARVNQIRQMAGLTPVVLDADLSRGCQLHARYLRMNRYHPSVGELGVHEESPDVPGYTPEGRRAARASIIHFRNSPYDAVEGWMATVFHRLPVLRPNLKRIGFGSEESVQVMDVLSGLEGSDDMPVAYPCDGQSAVPTDFGSEFPNPLPPDASPSAGYPMTLQFPTYEPPPVNVRAQLEDAAGNDVPFYLSDPEHPALLTFPQQNTVALIPANPLSPATTYRVTISGSVDGEDFTREWSFTTVAETEPPTLSDPQVRPVRLSAKGGDVTLRITATDSTGVASALAVVTQPDGSEVTVNLARTKGSATKGTWEGSFYAPANTTQKTQTYRATFSAEDVIRNRRSSAPARFNVHKPKPPRQRR